MLRYVRSVVLLLIVLAVGCAPAVEPSKQIFSTLEGAALEAGNLDALYEFAVEDSMVAEDGEIEPLFALVPGGAMATFDETNTRVLLLSWHKYPGSYPEGKNLNPLAWDMWTFTDKEIQNWFEQNKQGVEDWDMRLRQLLGLPPVAANTHVTALWVLPEDVVRPAHQADVTSALMHNSFKELDAGRKAWFDENILFSYYYSAYPWTRLGYTYDWNDNGKEYGLSEFLVLKGAKVKVAWTKSTTDFLHWLEAGVE